MDESETDSASRTGPLGGLFYFRFCTVAPMHLRAPSVDQGVQSFIWALVFFVILWLGMLAVGVSKGTALLLAAVAGVAIFLFVRTFGEDDVRPRRVERRP